MVTLENKWSPFNATKISTYHAEGIMSISKSYIKQNIVTVSISRFAKGTD